eukprot:136989_1
MAHISFFTLLIHLSLFITFAQDNFKGNRYCAFDNVSSINFSSSTNFITIVAPSVMKYNANPLFIQDKPWEERIDNGYPNVVYSPDDTDTSKTYQLWYDCFIKGTANNPHVYEGTLYAKSYDGIKWNKAELGINSWNGNKNNNIMFMNAAGIGIFKDVFETDSSQLYKAFGQLPGMPTSGGVGTGGIATSANGINNWSKFQTLLINGTAYQKYDTHNNIFYDYINSEKYVAITRIVPPRMVARAPALNKPKTFINTKFANAYIVENGGNDYQTYAQITFVYYNIYLGLVMVYASNTTDGRVYCELAWSPDSIKWYRIQENIQSLIPLSPLKDKAYDSYICFTAAYPIIDRNDNETIRLYYFGGNGPHDGARNSSFAMARIRMDGFAGVTNKNKNENAFIESYTLVVSGEYLFVNIDVIGNMNGFARVGLKNVEKFNVSDCRVINKNVTNSIVSWENGNSLNSLIGKSVNVQFELNNAVLYTFGFSNF